MHKSAVLAALALALGVEARNCKGGLYYCGKTLLNIGNYQDQINQALASAGRPQDYYEGYDSIFYCTGIQGGDIQWKRRCGTGCRDRGSDRDDNCNEDPAFAGLVSKETKA